ncbi:hypothetical protein WJX72_006714 [[Myrmecia] bisecta]|uniref:branched-chain-amino-acid transaminase n=1 Tax=[Myrmecia] bisecta TaxID=41462 RepID=A0AAW1QS63_9CHLO
MSTAGAADTFKSADLVVQETKSPKTMPPLEDLKFGTTFTDHMLTVDFVEGEGWGKPTIKPFGFLSMHPAAQVLHYGMGCFEGMKAYRGPDGRGRLFRPDMNMARFAKSAQRLHLANFDSQELFTCLKELLKLEKRWLPDKEGYSIYIRPFAFSSTHTLGVAAPSRTTLGVILSPVGPYFRSGLTPVDMFIDEKHIRAWPGGMGEHKVGGNYAPTISPMVYAATEHGCSQVIYSFPQGSDPDNALISESGAMNVMFLLEKPSMRPVKDRELVTAPLDGTILPGVTRDSVLELTRGWGEFEVNERPLTLGELKLAHDEGRLLEMIGCGTACIIQPIASVKRGNGDVYETVQRWGDVNTLTTRLTKQLTDIQFGHTDSEWSVPFE